MRKKKSCFEEIDFRNDGASYLLFLLDLRFGSGKKEYESIAFIANYIGDMHLHIVR